MKYVADPDAEPVATVIRPSTRLDPENQFCVECKARGRLNAGTLSVDGTLETNQRRIGLAVNHKVPHRGDQPVLGLLVLRAALPRRPRHH